MEERKPADRPTVFPWVGSGTLSRGQRGFRSGMVKNKVSRIEETRPALPCGEQMSFLGLWLLQPFP